MELLPRELVEQIVCKQRLLNFKVTCKKYNALFKEYKMQRLSLYIQCILRGQSRQLSFQEIYHTIYTFCRGKRCDDVIHVVLKVCRRQRRKLEWFEKLKYAKMIQDVCIYLEISYLRRNNSKYSEKSMRQLVMHAMSKPCRGSMHRGRATGRRM